MEFDADTNINIEGNNEGELEMSDKVVKLEDRVKPMRITDNVTGEVYELDFSRDSIRFAENRGFEMDSLLKFPNTKIPEFFYYAFRKNHKRIARSQTDEILENLGGLTSQMIERLIQLYNQAALTHVLALDEDTEKNERMTVEL